MVRNSMKDTTPYASRPAAEVERERACMTHIFNWAPPPEVIWEAFGGVGVTMEVMAKRFPSAAIRACELDPGCVEAYNARSRTLCLNATCEQFDASKFDLEGWPLLRRASWGVSLDFNRFTILDVRRNTWKVQLVRRAMAMRPAWIQLTDSARPYLHLKWEKSYGLPDRQPDTYVSALASELGTRVLAEAHHRAATYLLMEKT